MQGGQYTCTITGTGGCDDTKSTIVVINSLSEPVATSPQSFCITENASLNNIIINGQNIKWYDSLTIGLQIPETTVLKNGGNYYASQTIADCESNRILINTRLLAVADCDLIIDDDTSLAYPKYFTPNGDGFNDTWKIKFSDLETTLSIKIFDRYGKFLKELTHNNSWDGMLNGHELPATDYWFIVTRVNGNEYKGHFSLKR
ncbi:T9SS type B sorting domain-containing protein [Flavobacterium sp. Arc3]